MSEPLVGQDSPLRARDDLDRRQAAHLDAIAVIANVVNLLYLRLTDSLLRYQPSDSVEILLPDAWGMIDWVHRMDGLVRGCRGLSAALPFVVDYLNSSSLVENHRHAVQHLEGTIPHVEQSGRAPWGHLAWTIDLGMDPDGHRRFTRAGAFPSLMGGVDQEFNMGHALPPRTVLDHVSLFSADGEAEIGLTGQHESLVRFVGALQRAVESSGTPGPRGILKIQAPG